MNIQLLTIITYKYELYLRALSMNLVSKRIEKQFKNHIYVQFYLQTTLLTYAQF